ncbi:acyl carrier protein [Streptomyces sp. NPDC058439]|uniref:acyl carrier protein n=1 Tax=Streptomyces sp. NPDC058439 TaxID=3346500 RepID=UPI003653BBEF
MTEVEIFDDIKAFIEDKGLKGQGTIESDTPLLEWGILDSLTLARLTTHMEARYGIVVPSSVSFGERFRNLKSIVDFVVELHAGAGAADGAPGGVGGSTGGLG